MGCGMADVQTHAGALTTHGGRIDVARARYADAPTPWIDLSTGINPWPWTGPALATEALHALPSATALAELERAAGRTFGSGDLAVAALPGTEIGLRLLATLPLPAPFRIVTPSYRTHGQIWPAAEAIGAERIEEAAAAGGTLLLCNPNNPDGRRIDPERLRAVADRLGAAGGWLIVDEAFADACPGTSLLPLLSPTDRVIVLRSFGKFFGLAGLRLGFACGPNDMIGQMRDRLGHWPVSSAAISIGTEAYRDSAWIAQALVRLEAGRAALDQMLSRHGLIVQGACPLFRLVETPDAPALFERLAAAGILVRPFDYAPSWLRFGLPADAAALDRLDRALGG